MDTVEGHGGNPHELLNQLQLDTIDQLVRDTVITGTTVQYANGRANRAAVVAGDNINGTEVRKAVRTLQGNNAKTITKQIDPTGLFNTSPVAAAYVGIISEDTLYDLKNDPDWVPIEEYSGSDGRLGMFEKGKVDDVRFVLAGSNAKTFSSTVTVHATLICGQEAYGISRITGETAQVITKPLGSAGTDDPLNQRSTMGWKITLATTRLQENFMLRLEHAVTS